MKRLFIILCLLLPLAALADWDGWGGSPVRRPAPASGAVVDGHWVDPYESVFRLDWPTNNITARGSIGSAWDAGFTNVNVATANVLSNQPSVATGPAWTVLGTNSFGDVNYGWTYDCADDFIRLMDNDRLSLCGSTYGSDKAFTISGWMLTMRVFNTECNLLTKYHSGVGYEYKTVLNNAYRPAIFLYDGTNVGGNTRRVWTVNDGNWSNQWVYMTFVYDGLALASSMRIFTNAVEASTILTQAFSGTYIGMTNTPSGVGVGNLGWNAWGRTPSGIIAYAEIKTNALTPAEVTNQFIGNGGTNGPGQCIRKRLPAGAYP